MLDTIRTIVITIVTASGILGIFTKFMLNRIKILRQRQQALEKGIQALLRNGLIQQHDAWVSYGYAPVYIKDNFDNMYQQYHALGANGVMDTMYAEFMGLPTSAPTE